jgi:SAM-dependent methyltransferase
VVTSEPLARTLAGLAVQVRVLGYRRSLALALRNRLRRRLGIYPLCARLLEGCLCLEIGGPSGFFRHDGPLPIYSLASSVDNCTFAERTVWEGEVEKGRTFSYEESRPPGWQYIAEATDLSSIPGEAYEAVIASHVIEHVANPLAALSEWRRVLRQDGALVLVVPHREMTFDHRRPVTSLEHLVGDHERGVAEDDRTHLAEFLELFDFDRDPERRTREELAQRTARFAENRCLHHHVFDSKLVVRMLDRAGFELVGVETALPFHIVAVARRPPEGATAENDAFLAPDATWVRRSCFSTDQDQAGRSASS